jgi:hypothetical protein
MKKYFLLAGLFMGAMVLKSCGESEEKKIEMLSSPEAKELKAFMLMGMYVYYMYDGVDRIESHVGGVSSTEAAINAYQEYFIFPHEKSEKSTLLDMFSEWWGIENKQDLEKSMEKLLNETNPENPNKGWDYARIANNASMAYACDYLTKEEARKWMDRAMEKVVKEFKGWDDYLESFNKGRNTWDPESEDKEDYDKIVKNMLANKNGLYSQVPLK